MTSLDISRLLKQSWSTSWPMMLVMVFEFFMSMTDIYIAGLLGREIQAAVGISAQVYSFFVMAGYAITVGTVSVISKLYTSLDYEKFKSGVFTAVASAAFVGAILGILCIIFAPMLINLLNTPNEIKAYGTKLLQVYAVGLFFHMMLININGILRSCKMMKTSMIVMIITSLLNIILNIIFIKYTSLGSIGIALSTSISIFIGFLINLQIIYKIIGGKYIYSFDIIKRILSIGWPSGIVSISWQLGGTALIIVLGSLPDNSVDVIAAYAAGLRIESAIYMPAFAFNMANAVIIGNLMGEKRYNDAFKAGIVTAFMSVITISLMIAIILMNAKNIATILSKNDIVTQEIMKYLYICMISEPFIALNLAMSGALNGAGDTKATMSYAIITVWIVRLPLAYLFGIILGFGSIGVWWALNTGFFIQTILSTNRFLSKKWQLIK